jgi:hypothetical protein
MTVHNGAFAQVTYERPHVISTLCSYVGIDEYDVLDLSLTIGKLLKESYIRLAHADETEVQDYVAVSVKDAFEATDRVELIADITTQVKILHEQKMSVPVFLMQSNLVHLLRCADQIRVVSLSGASAIFVLLSDRSVQEN